MIARRVFVLVAVVLLGPASSDAGESAGTVSNLAGSAGARTLGMGGAGVAVVSGLDAIAWNPAGLARLDRTTLLAEHVNHSDIDTRQLFLVAGVPSWRWGTVAVGLHQIGVSDVEARDDRNVAGGSFSSVEQEVAVAYGIPMGPAWTVGATVKLQQQSVDAFRGSGIGADIGAMLEPGRLSAFGAGWLDGTTLGVRVRNLARPVVRLDQAEVPDARVLAAGAAWTHTAGAVGQVLFALDAESVEDAGVRMRAGTEWRILPEVALRTGVDGGTFTAGSEFRWNRFAVDYAFEDRELGATHRFGLSLSMGPRTSEAREIARATEDRALQARVDALFIEQAEVRRGEIGRDARAARDAGDLARAIEILAADETLLAGSPELDALLRTSLMEQGGQFESAGRYEEAALSYGRVALRAPGDSTAVRAQRRARAAGDRHDARDAEMRRRYNEAIDAFAREDFASARGVLLALTKEAPGDSGVALLLRRTEDAIGRRELARKLDATRRATSARRDTVAIATAAPSGPAPVPVPPDPALVREAQGLARRGEEAAGRREWDDAALYWELARSKAGGHRALALRLERLAILAGMDAYSAGRLDAAEKLWQVAARANPDDARIQAYLDRVRDQLRRVNALTDGSR
jgi:tetratricopeptide (TPR) repeat protein